MYNMHLIINTHWDREYRWSFSETQFRLAEAVDDLINIMNKDKEFTYFHTDSQTSMLDDYLDIRPERRAELEKLVAEGRILTGPWYTLPAEYLVSGEALVRNLLTGHDIAHKLGKVMKAGYNIFSWGQVSQLPQIYRQFGMNTIIFYRGVDQSKLDRLEFRWRAPDGTEALGITFGAYHRLNFWRYVYLPYILGGDSVSGDNHRIGRSNLGDAYLTHVSDNNLDMVNHNVYNQQCARDLPAALHGMQQLIDTVKDKSSVEDLLFLQGFDQENPDPIVSELVRLINEKGDFGTLKVASLEDYIATVNEKLRDRGIMEKLPVLSGEMLEVERVHDAFGPLYNGVFSARMPVKLQNSRCEALLTGRSEPIAVWSMLGGTPYPAVAMHKAWKELLKNQQHDGIGGCHVDRVTETMNERYRKVQDIGETVIKTSLSELAGRIDLSKLGEREIGLVIANTAFVPRSGIVECLVDIPRDWNVRWSGNSRRDFYLKATDMNGNPVDCQILSLEDDNVFGYLKFGNVIGYEATRCHFALQVKDVPANGYTTIKVEPYTLKQAERNPIADDAQHMENAFLAVDIQDNGTLSVLDKTTGRRYDRIHYFEDCSDKGGPLKFDPAYEKGMTTTLSQHPDIELIYNGELEATYRITYSWELPASIETDLRIHVPHGSEWIDQGRPHRSKATAVLAIATEVTLKKDATALEFKTTVNNKVQDHRLRVLFPTGLPEVDTCVADSPFDVVQRAIPVPDSTGWYEEAAKTWPTKSLVSVMDDKGGLSVYHCGLSEYEVTDNRSRSIAMTLLRCFSTAGNPTETFRYQELAECQGEFTFRYALDVTGALTTAERMHRAGNFCTPLHVVQVTPHEGVLPTAHSFMTVDGDSFVVTAMKKAEYEDAVLLRGYNESDEAAAIVLHPGFAVEKAEKVTLEEINGEPLTVGDGTVTVNAGPKEIVSVMLYPAE